MKDVVKKRIVGAMVLVAVGIIVPLLLVRWLQGPSLDTRTMRVYEITPSGGVQPVTAGADSNNASGTGSAGAGQAPTPKKQEEIAALVPVGKRDDGAGRNNGHDSGTNPGQAGAAQPEPTAPRPKPEGAAATTPSPAKPEPAKPPTGTKSPSASSLERNVAAGSWVVQVASVRDEQGAQALARKLKHDYAAYYTAADVNGQTWYRVRVGPLDNKAAADDVANKLRALGHNTLVVHID